MTYESSALVGLLERVEGSTGPDREIDCHVWAHDLGLSLEWQGTSLVAGVEGVIGWIDPGEHSRNFYTNRSERGPGSIPAYTASLDAALALVGRVLPGWRWMVRRVYPEDSGPLYAAYVMPADDRAIGDVPSAPTPALALIKALLRALLADAERSEGGG